MCDWSTIGFWPIEIRSIEAEVTAENCILMRYLTGTNDEREG